MYFIQNPYQHEKINELKAYSPFFMDFRPIRDFQTIFEVLDIFKTVNL